MTAVLTSPAAGDQAVTPDRVHDVLRASVLTDGMDLVLDLEASRGSVLVDARDGSRYLDMFTFFASSALGMNHPALADDPAFCAELARAAVNKPSNSDVYTVPMARFVQTFARVLGDPALPHLFFVDGGALAVENALKVAFDWKSRHNEANGRDPELGTRVLHLRGAFHGRSGYTLSLTNTDPNKVARFPKFDWPRIDAPYLRPGADIAELEAESLRQARAAFVAHPHDIACFIAEPVQGEGGDRHMRPEFFAAMRELCDEFDALLIFDEVQTGCGITGSAWAYQQLGVVPDVVAFGKKTQVCGVMAGRRVDDVVDNVFTVSSRINSTWGGNLTDMVRARRILEVVEAEDLIEHAADAGRHLLGRLHWLATEFPDKVLDPRGRGLMCAFSLPSTAARDELVRRLWDRRVIMLASGPDSVRFRPALTVSLSELDAAVDAVREVLSGL
ncbi:MULTISPECIES: L-lysine 6-transaminase [Mycobacteriaceae]|uniref:L-lysine-epsilon aminotransferase n=1 Tax=Mycolicibacterium neoaurum VKM Ac-1815D TaxID=700508 RepID=V5X9T6_MYCNE|nr:MULTISPECIES: L-lysine 6-transaminase [Mycobacteriaceae]AHC24558.1 L-lysine aminotransferase [Mycolicibacterium neoaurum VKM Ac-1815D]AMO05136.1 L-lysine aminotransferase [Mycolicibacterium neoaurum]AXK76557.1 L-lysine 6-transaminase [Mycolicibacterium neoaurum]KJQ49175.1 L-lysine aminotransferase [Mycolicibacterium neoaurum]KUM08565.1 L-lysine 6-transaminase [Mycolicibacterium neoaurum]